jgi:YHS domain-containing protein
MKKAILSITALALLAGALALVQTGCATSPNHSQMEMMPRRYPLDYCLVTGDKIGEMGAPVSTIYKSQEFKFCCKDCVKDFQKDPDKFLRKLAEVEQAARK